MSERNRFIEEISNCTLSELNHNDIFNFCRNNEFDSIIQYISNNVRSVNECFTYTYTHFFKDSTVISSNDLDFYMFVFCYNAIYNFINSKMYMYTLKNNVYFICKFILKRNFECYECGRLLINFNQYNAKKNISEISTIFFQDFLKITHQLNSEEEVFCVNIYLSSEKIFTGVYKKYTSLKKN